MPRTARLTRASVLLASTLCALTTVLWIRSYWRVDELRRCTSHVTPEHASSRDVRLLTATGRLGVRCTTDDYPNVNPAYADDIRQWVTAGRGTHYRQASPPRRQRPETRGFLGFQCDVTREDLSRPFDLNGVLEHHSTDVRLWLPLWLPVTLFALPSLTWAVRRSVRRAATHRIGHCPNCGYDLRATPGRCPECGRVAADAPGARAV